MKRAILFLVVVIVIGLVWWSQRGAALAPDQRLANHAQAMCKIAAAGALHPDDGVARLFRYYGERGPAMAHDWAELLVIIERIDDDRAHDDRARLAQRRIYAPAAACLDTFQRFADAVEDDPAASARVERGMTRFSRTIEILFGGGRDFLHQPFGGLDRLDALLAPR